MKLVTLPNQWLYKVTKRRPDWPDLWEDVFISQFTLIWKDGQDKNITYYVGTWIDNDWLREEYSFRWIELTDFVWIKKLSKDMTKQEKEDIRKKYID